MGMMLTFSNDVKYRIEKENIIICNCKNLMDFKLDIKYKEFIRNIEKGIKKEDIVANDEKLLFEDFIKINAIASLTIKPLKEEDYEGSYEFLKKHLDVNRSYAFLKDKLKENPTLFLGIYIENALAGIIQGFPREDYILISELVVAPKYQNRGFGTKLLKSFEKNAIANFKHGKIKVGVLDEAIDFYSKFKDYKKTLFIQIKKEIYESVKDKLNELSQLSNQENEDVQMLEFEGNEEEKVESLLKDKEILSKQYLFTKRF